MIQKNTFMHKSYVWNTVKNFFKLLNIICFALVATSTNALSISFETATLAGGCFWCTEADLEKAPGVISAISGYAGGKEMNPTYKEVSAGNTSHIESVQVTYDPALITYEELLQYFWRNIDPTDDKGQFADRGPQYRPAIFYHSLEQKRLALEGFKQLEAHFKQPIHVELLPYTNFFEAEEYHQDYSKKNPIRYGYYRSRSGRDDFIKKHWQTKPEHLARFKKPAADVLKNKIGELAYEVTQNDGTEKPFDNPYWDTKEPGLYVDILSGEPLFSSLDKYDSGTGWPSFTKPIVSAFITERQDFKLILPRTEVRSSIADSHLGHVFKDGPAPTGLRYCINSAALRFIPAKDLEKEGYGHYSILFEASAQEKTKL